MIAPKQSHPISLHEKAASSSYPFLDSHKVVGSIVEAGKLVGLL